MKTLYVTDLDGTLMRDDKTISNESAVILNRLLAQDMFFTYATARSLSSASEITKNISFKLPVIVRNGTILADPESKEEIEISMFGEELQPLYERVKHIEGINCVFQQDKYRPEYWLELCPGNATKATAIQRVKQL